MSSIIEVARDDAIYLKMLRKLFLFILREASAIRSAQWQPSAWTRLQYKLGERRKNIFWISGPNIRHGQTEKGIVQL